MFVVQCGLGNIPDRIMISALGIKIPFDRSNNSKRHKTFDYKGK